MENNKTNEKIGKYDKIICKIHDRSIYERG